MTELEQVDFARYSRWIDRLVQRHTAWLACDREGVPIWSREAMGQPTPSYVLQWLFRRGIPFAPPGDGIAVHDLEDGHQLVVRPIELGDHGVVGYLGAIVDAGGSEAALEIDSMAELLDDVATAVRDEYRLKSELDTMATELAERYEELHLVYAVDHHLRRNGTSVEIFQGLIDNCARHLCADIAALVRPAPGQTLYADNLSAPIHNLDLVLVEMRGDLFRFVSASRQPLVLNDAKDPRRSYIFTDMPYKVMACPVYKGEEIAAMLVLLNQRDKGDFRNSDRRLAEVVANHLSGLVRMDDMLAEMTDFTQQMAAALIESVEAKDPYTRGHSERVHHLSMEIGRATGLDPGMMEHLHWASLLHDVGKIGIPDAILCKPDRLTHDEYTFIMVHPERSYEILRHIERLREALPGVRHHQEKYDGTGYPLGLKGNAIPLLARIIAVADTYDSITSSRAYRAGRTHEAAIAEMRRVSGSQLDPDLFATFLQLCAAEPEWLARFRIRRE
jgi:HD domain/GAF domain